MDKPKFDSKKLSDMIKGLRILSRRAKKEEEGIKQKVPESFQISESSNTRSDADEEDLLIDKMVDVIQNDIIKPPNVLKSELFPDGFTKYEGEEFQVEKTLESTLRSNNIDPDKFGSQIFAGIATVFERQAKNLSENPQKEEPIKIKMEKDSSEASGGSTEYNDPQDHHFKLVKTLDQNKNKYVVEFTDPNVNPRTILKVNRSKFVLNKIEKHYSFK